MFDEALKLINKITDNGFKAYIVGGFVRDYLLGLESNDIDVTTNATPMELMDIFKDGVEPKTDYGSLTVIYHSIRFEITTFRKDIGYVNNRRPDRVEYIDSLYDDLIRRDFTVNSLCIDNNGEVVDLLSARGDLDNKKARSEKEALLEQYCILTNKLGEEKVKILFATAYNRYGEGRPWTQGRVLQFFSRDELCISRDFWNLICKSEHGYDVVIDEYKKDAHYINEALNEIKDAYLPNE